MNNRRLVFKEGDDIIIQEVEGPSVIIQDTEDGEDTIVFEE